MVRFYTNSPEEKEQSNMSVYMKCVFAGIVVASLSILSGLGIKYMVIMVINYWHFALFGVAILLVFRYALKRKKQIPQYPPELYNR